MKLRLLIQQLKLNGHVISHFQSHQMRTNHANKVMTSAIMIVCQQAFQLNIYNHVHNILRLFGDQADFSFTASETKSGYW